MSEPLYRYVPGPGIVSVRTDWTKKAIQLLAVCGIVTESHQDRSAGTFLLASGADWLVSTAKNLSHSGIRQDAVDWACLVVDGNRQVQTHDGCRYLAQENTDAYTFLQMDLAAAYQGQLTKFTRELFFLKPGLLMVRDFFNPTNQASQVTWNLNVLELPVLDLLGGFTAVGDSGNKLFGIAQDWKFIASQVPLEPAQTRPTFRLQLQAAGSQSYVVGLEVAPPQQPARNVTPFAATNLRGMVCNGNLVAAVVLPPPFSYTSPAAGQHWLYGLSPSGIYQVNGNPVQASAAGVLAITRGVTAGQPVTIAVGAPPPPPPPPVKGRTFQIFLPADGSAATISEIPPSARPDAE